MIIHSPIISGSMTFADGASVTYPEGGVYSGSFSGSFQGEGSNLTFGGTGIVSSSAQIDDLFNLDGVFSASSQVEFNDINNNPLSQSDSSVTLSKSMVPSATNIDLGTAENPFRDVYISSASLYINGTQVISTDGTDLTIQTDAGESFKVLETGNDTITLETANGDITLSSNGNGNIELDAPVQVAAHKKILSSDGNAIQFGNGLGVTGSIAVTGTVDGIDVSGFKNTFNSYTSSNDTTNTNQDSRLSNIEAATSSYQPTLSITDTSQVDLILSSNTLSANLKGGVVSGSAQITDVLTSVNSYTASNDTTNTTQNSRLDQLSTETGSITTEQSIQDSRLTYLETYTGSNDLVWATSDDKFDTLETYTSSVDSHIASTSNPHSVTKSQVGLGNVENTALSTWAGSSNITTLGTVTNGDVQAILPSGTISGSSQVQAGSITGDIALGTQTSGNYVATLGSGTGVTIGSNTGEGSTPTIAVNYGSSANTAVQGNTTLSFAGTSNEISIDGGDSITLGSGGTVTIGLADSIAGDRTFSNNVTITGNLTVNGTTTTVNSNTVNIGDNVLVLNSDETGTPSQNGGIEIERGSSTNSALLWDEGNDYWVAGLAGAEERIVIGAGNTDITTLGTITTGTWNGTSISTTYTDAKVTSIVAGTGISISGATGDVTITNSDRGSSQNIFKNFAVSGQTTVVADSNNDTLTLAAGSNVTISTNASTDTITIASTDTNTTYSAGTGITLTGTTFSTNDSQIVHDSLSGFVANEHIDHTSVSISAGTGLTGGGTIAANRTLSLSHLGLESLTDPNADRVAFWDDSAGAFAWLTMGSNLSISGTTLNATDTNTTYSVSDTSGQTGIDLTLSGTTISGVTSGLTTSSTVQFAKVGVGTAADATYELKVSGDIGATGDIVAYISSDERLKDNIELISNPIEKVQSLRGVTWDWNDNASEAAKQSPNVGVIAQEVEKVLPQLVHDRENGYKGVDYAKLTGLLIEAIKDQQKQIDDLKSKLG